MRKFSIKTTTINSNLTYGDVISLGDLPVDFADGGEFPIIISKSLCNNKTCTFNELQNIEQKNGQFMRLHHTQCL